MKPCRPFDGSLKFAVQNWCSMTMVQGQNTLVMWRTKSLWKGRCNEQTESAALQHYVADASFRIVCVDVVATGKWSVFGRTRRRTKMRWTARSVNYGEAPETHSSGMITKAPGKYSNSNLQCRQYFLDLDLSPWQSRVMHSQRAPICGWRPHGWSGAPKRHADDCAAAPCSFDSELRLPGPSWTREVR